MTLVILLIPSLVLLALYYIDSQRSSTEHPLQISIKEAKRQFENGSAVPVDVRDNVEWKHGHLPGAIHLPMAHMKRRAHELPDSTTLVVYGNSVYQSRTGAMTLRSMGFMNARYLPEPYHAI